MSRTDKDRPWRVRSNDPTDKGLYERHYCGVYLWKQGYRECDLNEPTTRDSHPFKCVRIPSSMRGWGYGPKPSERRIEHKKQRSHDRDEMKQYIKDYREYGEVDDEMPFREGIIHFPLGGGYWD